MHSMEEVKNILADTLNLGARKANLTANTPLLGNLPELDSMAVIHVLTALEEHFGIVVDDDDISANTFESVASLSAFVDGKLAK